MAWQDPRTAEAEAGYLGTLPGAPPGADSLLGVAPSIDLLTPIYYFIYTHITLIIIVSFAPIIRPIRWLRLNQPSTLSASGNRYNIPGGSVSI